MFGDRIAGDTPTALNIATSDQARGIQDITLTGRQFGEWIKSVVEDAILTRHNGILVDATPEGMPYCRHFTGLEITDWDYDSFSSQETLRYVKLADTFTQVNLQTMEEETYTRYRLLTLENGTYRHRVFIEGGSREEVRMLVDTTPTIAGSTLDFIPFYFLHGSPAPKVSIVDSITDLNETHYRTSALYQDALRNTNTPFLSVISNQDIEGLVLSTTGVAQFEPAGGDEQETSVEWIESSGSGIAGYEAQLRALENQMDKFGNLFAQPVGGAVESAEALSLRNRDSDSVVSCLVRDIEDGITSALTTYNQFAGSSAVPVFNFDVDEGSDDPSEDEQIPVGLQQATS